MGAAKANKILADLLRAEESAQADIDAAKQRRKQELKKAKDEADQAIAEFRVEQEKKHKEESADLTSPSSAKKSSATAELNKVQADYDKNKTKTVKYVVDKVLDVQISLSETQKQSLRMGA